ncbi:MAG: MFS transporter [Thermoleophilaceae bacterium]
MTASAAARPKQETSPWVVLLIVSIAQFMVVLDATVTNVALPSIQRDLHFTQSSLQWVINSYTLLFGGFLLLGGRAGDLFGRRRVFMVGVGIFSLASLFNGLATSSEMLIAGRALQGFGAALVSPAALSIVTTSFSEGAERTKALGIWSGIAAGGGAVGLLVGGILTDALSWPWVFYVNVPVGIAALALAVRFVPESRAKRRPDSVDAAGAVSVTGGLLVLVYAIVKAQDYGWGSARTIGLSAVAVALLVAFVAIERRSKAPLIRLGIFRQRSLTGANAVLLLVASGLFAMFFFTSIYAQEILGYSPLKAGLAFLPVTAGIGLGAGSAQQLIRRFGVRPVAGVGMTLATVGMFLLTGIAANGTYASDLLPGLLFVSIGMGLTFVPITLIATTGVAAEDAGLASGIFNTAQQVGGALGLAVLSTLAANATTNHLQGLGHKPGVADRAVGLVDGFQVAFLAGGVLMAAAVALMLVLVRPTDVELIDLEAEAVMAPA